MQKKQKAPVYTGKLRKKMVTLPEVIYEASGIKIFGKKIKSLVFSTDIAIIRNCNAHGVIAVYPFTPQPTISHAILTASDIPVFVGVGGGTTAGDRVIALAEDAEFQGALGVVVNAPTSNETIIKLKEKLDIPVVLTVVSMNTNIAERIEAGADIFNVSGGSKTAEIVRHIRSLYPDFPIIATGGPTEESIRETIQAGANCITYTPPTNGEIFAGMMKEYRNREN